MRDAAGKRLAVTGAAPAERSISLGTETARRTKQKDSFVSCKTDDKVCGDLRGLAFDQSKHREVNQHDDDEA